MTSNHPAYKIEGPALISFSGGRTSGYMLHEILRAHGGELPPDVHVVFANTGKERPETLDFVAECSRRWNVWVNWVEWRKDTGYALVDFDSASRAGEPFAQLIAHKGMPPNWQARFCTQFLKVVPMTAFATAGVGFRPGEYAEVIGLRHDEGIRLMKMMERNVVDGRDCLAPLSRARAVLATIMGFWAEQPFDLQLKAGEGNCDLCFLKGRGLRKEIIRQDPTRADWWARQEEAVGGFFDRRDRYADLKAEVFAQPDLFVDDGFEHDVECGLLCAPEP